MFGKNCFGFGLLLLISHFSFAQNFDLEEKKPVAENGFEYGYIIKNEQTKTSKGEEYSRYEVTLYVTNNSGCTKLYRQRTNIPGEESSLLATYNCTNANGKRFTSKSGKITARNFYVDVKHKVNDKEVTESVKTGYIFRNGETLRSSIIVLVPKGERPQFQCLLSDPDELR